MFDCLDSRPYVTLKGKSVPLRCGKCPPCMKKKLANREAQNKKYQRLRNINNVD